MWGGTDWRSSRDGENRISLWVPGREMLSSSMLVIAACAVAPRAATDCRRNKLTLAWIGRFLWNHTFKGCLLLIPKFVWHDAVGKKILPLTGVGISLFSKVLSRWQSYSIWKARERFGFPRVELRDATPGKREKLQWIRKSS